MRLYLSIALLLFPLHAHAMAEVIQAVGLALTFVPGPWAVVGWVLLVAGGVYGAEQQRKAAARAQEDARKAFNAGLQDRTLTSVTTEAPFRYVYGRARVGSAIVAIFTSGARDEYKWLVCIHAAHECDAVEEVYIAGKALGALDGSGDVTSASPDYYSTTTTSVSNELHIGNSFTLSHTPVAGTLRVTYAGTDGFGNDIYISEPFTLSGANVTITSGIVRTYYCHYEYVTYFPRVRVVTHLGAAGDAADAGLMAAFPALWASTAKLSGFCYSVVRLDLNQAEFQSGIPTVEVLLRGKKLYDVRDASTAWSRNNALAIYDYLTSEMCGVDPADLPLADYIAAANVCDETITINGASAARYTINGDVRADQDQGKVLEQMAQSMAGIIVATTWSIQAGKYIAPVLALDQSDIVGALAVTPGASDADVYNGVKGQFITAENDYVATDFTPFQNATYVAADGREIWSNIDFPFTDGLQRVHNLARIFTEDQRNGYILRATFSNKVWDLPIGSRITFDSAFLGQSAKVYRLTDKKYDPGSVGIELALKEDAASIWDEADAVVADSTPNTTLTNPFTVGLPGNVTLAETLYTTSGSVGVRSKATVSWDAPADVTVLSYWLQYKPYTSGDWIDVPNIVGTSYDFADLAAGQYDFRVKARNVLGASGEFTAIKTFSIYGLTAAPADMTGFSCQVFNGEVIAEWDLSADLDVRIGGYVQIRRSPLTTGTTFSDGTVVRKVDGYATSAKLPLATGTYMAKFIDSTGHFSATEASFVVTEALLTGWTTVLTDEEHVALGSPPAIFAGAKTDCEVSGLNLILSDPGGSPLPAGLTAIYDYYADLDCGSVASRRYHGHIKAHAYNADGLFDSADLFDSGEMFDETDLINGFDAWQEIRVSDDDATWGAWTRFDVADFSGRYAQVRLQLSRDDTQNNIEISELSTSVKIPA